VALIVLLAVHFQNKDDLFFVCKESFSVVLGNSALYLVVDQDFFIIGLIVLSICDRLQSLGLFEEGQDIKLGSMLFESQPNELIVSLLQQMKSICVSHHDELELSQNLSIDDS